jgi:uncharacterized protein YciI
MQRLRVPAAAAIALCLATSAFAQPSAAPAKVFLCRLVPPRADFMANMTPAERAVMTRHVAYWTEQAKKGQVMVFGPVADPKGAWGLLILRAADQAELDQEIAADPAITGGIGMRYDVLPFIRISVPAEFVRGGS